MPRYAIERFGANAGRFCDYPMSGSIYTRLDNKSLVRGPTLVRLDNGHDVQVPAKFKHDIKSSAQLHDMDDDSSMLKQLMAVISGKKVPDGPNVMRGFELSRGQGFVPRHILCPCQGVNKTCSGMR